MSANTLQFIFIDNKLLVQSKQKTLDSTVAFTLTDIARLPQSLNEHQHQAQELIVSSKYGKHLLLDLHHLDIEDDSLELLSLRELLATMHWQDFQYVAQAWQYALFLRTHRYCGRCGEKTRKVNWEMAMHCDKCSHRVYPRVSPCIIVAIHNDKQILLAQGARQSTAGFYSTLAGFVESAESLEQAIHREVMEEVGVKVTDIEYFGSQPWPFPHSLMVGYIARHKSGDIKVDGREILDAQWFDIDNLPNIPPKLSIAGRLIDETLKRIEQNRKN